MTTVAEIRDKYPQYSDLSDDELLRGIHAKSYSDMPYEEFAAKVTPAPEPDNASAWDMVRHVAGGVPQGAVFDQLDAPYNMRRLLEQGASWATDRDVSVNFPKAAEYALPTALMSRKFSERPGVSQAKEFLAKETVDPAQHPWVDAARTGLEWASGGVYAKALKMTMAPDIIMGVFAALGDAIQNQSENPEGAWGEVIGGMTGLVAALRYGRPDKLTRAQRKAVKFLEENTENPKQAMDILEDYMKYVDTPDKEVGTLADVTGDRGLFNVETGAALDPRFGDKIKDVELARQTQIAENVERPFGTAVAGTSQDVAGRYVRRASGNVERRADRLNRATDESTDATQRMLDVESTASESRLARARAAQDQAEATAQSAEIAARESQLPLATGKRPSEASTDVRRVVSEEAGRRRSTANEAWETFKAQPDVDISSVSNRVDSLYESVPPRMATQLKKNYGELLDELKDLAAERGGRISGAEYNSWRRDVQAMMKSRNNPNDPNGVKWVDSDDAMSDFLKQADEVMEKANPYFREAQRATIREKDVTARTKAGKALRTAEPEEFVKRSGGLSNEGGAVFARELLDTVNAPNGVEVVTEALKSEAATRGLNEKFLTTYGDVLDKLPPETSLAFRRAVEANLAEEAAKKAAKEAAKEGAKAEKLAQREATNIGKREKGLYSAAEQARGRTAKQSRRLDRAINETNLANYAKSPGDTIRPLLRPDRGEQLGALYRSLLRRGEGASFKGAVRDQIRKMFLEGSDTSVKVSPSAQGKWEEMRDTLYEAAILNEDEIAHIDGMLNRTETVSLRQRSWAQINKRMESEIANLGASGAAAVALRLLPGSSLVLAGAVKRVFKKIIPGLNSTKKTEAMVQMEEFLLNPEKYYVAAKNAKTAEEAASNILREVFGASLAAEAMNRDEEEK